MKYGMPPALAEQFKRVCPEWAKHILSGRFNPDSPQFVDKNNRRWNMMRSFCCIVGEAHKRQAYHGPYGSAYACNACGNFSLSLLDVHDKEWQDTLRRFLDHYEKEHPMEVAA